jgi:hypothetical protein
VVVGSTVVVVASVEVLLATVGLLPRPPSGQLKARHSANSRASA